jgi:hypothetical protein
MKKKRFLLLGLAAVALLALAGGCGTNKNLSPESDLKLHGADPPSENIQVDPPLTHLVYFVFTVKLSDPELSMVPADAWTIDSYEITYSTLSDPGQHLLAPPDPVSKNIHTVVQPNNVQRLPVTLITDTYLRTNAAGFIGTSDTATIKAHAVFRAHRNKDGYPKTLVARYLMTLGNF